MSRSRWLVLVSCLAVAIPVLTGPTSAEQPALTPPSRQPAGQPQPRPPITSEYPRLPPVPSYPGAAPALPRGTTAPGATQATQPLPPPPAPKREESYLLAVMVADAAWIWGTWKLDSPGLLLGGYIGAAPLTHALMGNSRSAWISAGLRAGAVAFTAGAAIHAYASNCDDCEAEVGLVVLGLVGAGTVMLADWLVLARREVPVEGPVQPRSAPAWAVTPQVNVGQGGLQLGLGGWF
jgi:hypothetical protein